MTELCSVSQQIWTTYGYASSVGVQLVSALEQTIFTVSSHSYAFSNIGALPGGGSKLKDVLKAEIEKRMLAFDSGKTTNI